MEKSLEELKALQNKFLDQYESVKLEILKVDNVVAVGIGLKEREGRFTDEFSFRVYVTEKKDVAELAPSQVVPKVINNFKTDVIPVGAPVERVFVERQDESEYRPVRGGIALNNEFFKKETNSFGTLGWFGNLADSTRVVLTCKHVLYDTPTSSGVVETNSSHVKLTQPYYDKSCCCECGVIGETIIGIKNSRVDCGIAKLNADVEQRLFLKNSASTETLRVALPVTATAVVGSTVRKVGARSGFTTGTIVHIGDTAAAATDSGGTTIVIQPNQILIIPDPAETYEIENGKKAFSNGGDSGSIILNSTNQIVGLLWGGDSTTNNIDITWANNIADVLSALSTAGFPITLASSPPPGPDRRGQVESLASSLVMTDEGKFSLVLDEEREPNEILQLIKTHRDEVLSLINNNREVKVVWQRLQGPAYAAHFMNSAKDPSYKFPKQVKEISLEAFLLGLAKQLRKHGGELLRGDVERHGYRILEMAGEYNTVFDMIEQLKKPMDVTES
jgi:hypothetical protein